MLFEDLLRSLLASVSMLCPPVCPQSGLVIEGYVPNTALETILSRHTFQSQGTRDVLDALKQFTEEGGVSEGEQPLEEYVQANNSLVRGRGPG